MALSSPGIGSNLDVNSIISQLMTAESAPLTQLAKREASYQAKLSAFGSLKGAVSSFQNTVHGLSSASRFISIGAKVADSSVMTVSSASTAVPGSYSVEVQTLAQSQKLRTDFTAANVTDAVGTGTLSFSFGTWDGGSFTLNPEKGTQTVTIDAAHNSLSGIRDAINAANMGVTASIFNDGTTNRLVLTSDSPGLANSLKIGVTDDDGNNTDMSGLSRLAYDPAAAVGTGKNLVQSVPPTNATLVVDGVTISKASNTITDAIQGVTLTLLKTNVGTPTTVTVSRDTASSTQLVNDFIKGYNELAKTIKDLSGYNAETKEGGVLLGDSAVLALQRQLRGLLTTSVKGLDGSSTTLSSIGVSFQKDGTLKLDSTKLQKAMAADPESIAAMFAAIGRPTDSLVKYTSSTTSTQPGQYALSISQLATQGSLQGSQSAGLAITAGVNDTLSVTLDGVTASVTLTAGVYASYDALAAEVQSRINGATAFTSAGSSVTVTHSGGTMTVTSARYGSASTVALSGNGAANLMGAAPVAANGLDVAGTINGLSATGSGRFLTGFAGDVSGLKLEILGGGTGDRGTVNYVQGYAFKLDQFFTQALGSGGTLSSRTDGINDTIKDIAKQRTVLQKRLTDIEKRYRAQFTALDQLISQMTQTSNYLSQQLANLPTVG